MANEQNLRRNLSPREARENGSKGGKKSVESRRKKKLLRECLEALLEREMEGNDGEKVTGAEAMAVTAFRMALDGDLEAWKLVRDTTGQKPVEKVVTSDVDPEVMAEIDRLVSQAEYEDDTP